MSRLVLIVAVLAAGEARAEELEDASLEELMEIDVEAATRAPQSAREVPSIVTVITREDLRTWGFQSVGEALVLVPGMYCIDDQVSTDCGVRGITAGARGGSRIVKVMIDGQPVAFRSDGTNFLGPELIPIVLVERIEVVRGPVSALHGANAFFGAINVVTRRRADGPRMSGVFGVDGELGYGGAAVVMGGSGGWRYVGGSSLWTTSYDGRRLPGSSPDFDELEAAGNLESDGTSVEAGGLFLRGGYLGERWELDGSLRFALRSASAEFADFARLTHETTIATYTLDARLLARGQVLDNLTLTGSVAGATGGPDEDREWLATGSESNVPRREFGYRAADAMLEARLTFRSEDSFTLGVDGSLDDEDLIEIYSVDRETGVATRTSEAAGRRTFGNGGIYAQAIVHPIADLGLTGNLRYDQHSQYGGALTYRLGAVYAPTRLLAGKLLYGTSFKAPPVLQLYSQPLFPGEVIGNDDLEPERAAHLEGSVSLRPLPELAFNLVGYWSRVRDKVELVPVAANLQPTNVARQEGLGVEAEAWWRPGRHALAATLAYQDTDTVTDSVFVGETTSPSERYPGLVEQLRWSWNHPRWGRPGAALRYVSSRRASVANIRENLQTPYALDPYLELDLVYTSPSFRRATLSLRADNLTDADDAEPGFGGVDLPRSGRRFWLFVDIELDHPVFPGEP
jgi:outer membrane receptor protein involved in Fe transport